jgi:hypothetical protein
MKQKQTVKTGGKRLAKMISGGVIDRPWLFIDTYNQRVLYDETGTILTGIDFRNMYYVTVPDERRQYEIQTKPHI